MLKETMTVDVLRGTLPGVYCHQMIPSSVKIQCNHLKLASTTKIGAKQHCRLAYIWGPRSPPALFH